ncbi:hypothetical protein [Desulforamulus ferrireducens]|uniref:TIGR04255 family protein n=1 Tax=Desulforamulus ferrireducens TaxID=1833852 RepID=A0A1S6IT88_9FIRM|nr:hypothetical protein [Desulforamulus ferrireducens]AQS57999.1 hypothetical protein B0537_02125 [Desulforamulus ferrireducens]
MKVKSLDIQRINITLVFEELDRDFISRDFIRNILTNKPIIHELPDVLLIVYPDIHAQAVIEGKRISLNIQYKNEIASNIYQTLSILACGFKDAVTKGNLIAYGYNYDGIGEIEEDMGSVSLMFKEKFLKEQKQLEDYFGGEIFLMSPKFSLRNRECEIHVEFQPISESSFSYHLNVHFNTTQLPNFQAISDIGISKFEFFKGFVARM